MIEPVSFRMPPLPEQQWFDADGAPIAYGERWGMAGPPDSAYSVVTNPQRYAPLYDVADALVAHLLVTYDCVAEDAAAEPRDVRAVRVRPAGSAEGAGIRIAWTDFPGVRARLGGEVDDAAPFCGCDACDESLEHAAWQLRDRVLEAVTRGPGAWHLRAV